VWQGCVRSMGAVCVVTVRPLAQTGEHQQRRTSKEGEKDEKSSQHGEAIYAGPRCGGGPGCLLALLATKPAEAAGRYKVVTKTFSGAAEIPVSVDMLLVGPTGETPSRCPTWPGVAPSPRASTSPSTTRARPRGPYQPFDSDTTGSDSFPAPSGDSRPRRTEERRSRPSTAPTPTVSGGSTSWTTTRLPSVGSPVAGAWRSRPRSGGKSAVGGPGVRTPGPSSLFTRRQSVAPRTSPAPLHEDGSLRAANSAVSLETRSVEATRGGEGMAYAGGSLETGEA
jgi:hypothetical protein